LSNSGAKGLICFLHQPYSYNLLSLFTPTYQGADKSLAQPGRKQPTATNLLTSASHSKKIHKVVRSTGSQWQ